MALRRCREIAEAALRRFFPDPDRCRHGSLATRTKALHDALRAIIEIAVVAAMKEQR